ncbi:MAG: hypothetical protein JNL21_14335 [Myxococcales bacterium]|nr:hypothetical protein [Myxococcales bacterium]
MRFLTASSLVLGLAIGCSSEVDTVDGTGGSGGSTTVGGTTTVTTGSVSTSVGTTTVSTTSSVSSSSTGGGNNCEQGCAHILECTGFDACAMGVDCQNPMFDCPMSCINDASCADIIASTGGTPPPALQACLSACQGGQGGGGQGGGAPNDCQGCVFQNDCVNPCFNDQDCIQGWGQCAQGCTDPACFAACDAMFPQTAPIFDQIYDCACMGCSSECETTMDPCNAGAGGGP